MAAIFANADSVKQAIFEELQNILHPDANVRKTAEKRMKQLEFTEGYGVYLTEIIMNQSFELATRQLACVMLRRYVETQWEDTTETEAKASEQVKRAIRNILPNGLYDQSSKIRSGVAKAITTIAASDWPNIWTELIDVIIKCLGGNENSIHGAVQVLIEFSYDEKQIKELGPIIISEVYRIFKSKQYSIKTRTCALKILKPLFYAINYSITNKQDQANMMDSILSNFIPQFVCNLSVDGGLTHNLILKTEILKVLTFLVVEMPKSIQPYMNQILPPIWQLLTQIADIYVKSVVNLIEPNIFELTDDEDDELNFSTMIIQTFEFIQCIISTRKFNSIIKNVLTDLIYIMIVYMQLTQEQSEMYIEDTEKFVEQEDNCGVDLTIRLSGQDVLSTLKDEFNAKTLVPLSEALRRHSDVAEAEKSSGNPNWWKIHEAVLVAIYNFREVIQENQEQFELFNYLTLVRNLMNYQTSPHLLGRWLWTISVFPKLKFYTPPLLEDILSTTLESLSPEKSIVLKISAIRAIYGFVSNLEKSDDERRNIVISKLVPFVDGIIALTAGCKSSLLAIILEALTAIISFDNNLVAVHNKIISLNIAIFLKYTEEPYILGLVQDMLKVLSQNPLCLHPLQEKIIPTLISIFNLEGDVARTSSQDIALDVLTTLVKYSQPPLSKSLIEDAFPAAIQCILKSDDNSILQSGGECLRAFIHVSPNQVSTYKNGEGLKYAIQVTTLLLNPMNSEFTASQVGHLLITIISKFGTILGESIDLLLKAVISKMQLVDCLKVMMSLVVIFAHLVLTQIEAVLNFLTTVPGPSGETAMQFVLNNWLTRQSSFFGTYERKVTAMALCKLFEYGVTTQDSRLTSISIKELRDNFSIKERTRSQTANAQVIATIPALVKILKLIIHEISSIREAKNTFEDSDDSTSDDNDCCNQNYNDKITQKVFFDEEDLDIHDDSSEDDFLLLDPLLKTNLEEYLTNFLQSFSKNEHFAAFANQLDEHEIYTLQLLLKN